MRLLVSIALLGSMSDIIAGDLLAQDMLCQVQHVGIDKLLIHLIWISLIVYQARILLDRDLR